MTDGWALSDWRWLTANQGGSFARPGSPMCADSADSIGLLHKVCLHAAHVPMHSETMAYQHLKRASLAKCLCFLCNNNSILCKRLVWPLSLKCAKSFNPHGNGNDLEAWGYIHLWTWCCKCHYASIKFQLHTGTDPSGAGFQNSCRCFFVLLWPMCIHG